MKLKKIASLALAGVMAVSMLAGCAGKTNSNTETETSASTDLAAIANDRMAGKNVKFTEDAEMSADMQQILKVYGTQAVSGNQLSTGYKNDLKALTGLKDNKALTLGYAVAGVDNTMWNSTLNNGYMLSENATYAGTGLKKTGDLDGETLTVWDVFVVTNVDTAEAAMNSAMKSLADYLNGQKFPSEQSVKVTSGNKYYVYNYDGTVSMASYKDSTGATTYLCMYKINQHVSTKTVG